MASSANETPASQTPPAVLSAAQRHDLARQFERAKQLAAKSPPDFVGVHRVLSEVCTLDPGNTLFVAALLENLQRARGKTMTAWFWQVWKLRAEFLSAIQSRNWRQTLSSGWMLLGQAPRDAEVYAKLAQVCGELDHLPTQIQLLQEARKKENATAHILAELGRALAAAGQFQQSAAVWREYTELNREHEEGYQFLDALGEPFETAECDEPVEAPKTMSLPLRVAKLIEIRKWDAAEELLAAESGSAGADLELRTLGEEIVLGRARDRTAIAERLFHFSTKAIHRRLIGELLEEQRRIELGVAFARYERFSSAPESSWELAQCLSRVGNFSEALKYLDRLKEHSRWQLRGLIAAGENWQQLRQFDRALAAYRTALAASDLDSQDEHVQRGWYRGAVLAEASRQPELAIGWLERLTAVNPAYKDAAARLDNLRLICHKGGFPAEPLGDSSRGA